MQDRAGCHKENTALVISGTKGKSIKFRKLVSGINWMTRNLASGNVAAPYLWRSEMSAVATAEAVPMGDAVSATLAVAPGPSNHEVETAEMYRWMVWFGTPLLVVAFFVGMVFATGQAWWLGLAITTLIVDIFVLVWLAMSSDTNGVIVEPAHAH
jgi:membrane protein insertase Oxa1/YidC/SpoIIIJ